MNKNPLNAVIGDGDTRPWKRNVYAFSFKDTDAYKRRQHEFENMYIFMFKI